MKIKYLMLGAISGAVITADQVVKMYIHTHFVLGDAVTVIRDFFDITYVRNPGAAFGFLAATHPFFREMFFLSMPPVALLIILAILRGVPEEDRLTAVSLSLVFGGAIGNYIDRLRFRYVIDYLDFHVRNDWHYPAFNIADMAIVCGVAILVYFEVVKFRRLQKEKVQA